MATVIEEFGIYWTKEDLEDLKDVIEVGKEQATLTNRKSFDICEAIISSIDRRIKLLSEGKSIW